MRILKKPDQEDDDAVVLVESNPLFHPLPDMLVLQAGDHLVHIKPAELEALERAIQRIKIHRARYEMDK